MPLTELPPLEFDDGGLRLSLFSPANDALNIPIALSAADSTSGDASSSSSAADTPTAAAPEPRKSSGTDDNASDMRRPASEHEPDSEPKQEPEAEPKPEFEPQSQPVPDRQPESQPHPESEPEPDPEHESEPEPDTSSEPGGKIEAEKHSGEPSIPTHPISSMQGAFAESLHEVTHGGAELKPKLRAQDAKGRRDRLVDQGKDDDTFDVLWRYRPGQQQHELLKLISQISFGVYLLLNGMANDNTQVVSILQGHIDEVDEFLEITLEDLGQASQDLSTRIDHLQLPMANMQAFEEMLADRNFRAEILEGNEKIEHVLARTNVVMKQWDDDIEAGLTCSTAFMSWLNGQKDAQWRTERPDLIDIFDAMKGNADGWLNAFDDMNARAQDINGLVIKLMSIVAEMEKTAGEVSRKTWANVQPFTSPKGNSSPFSSPPSTRPGSKATPRASIHSGSVSTVQLYKAKTIDEDDEMDEFPLPGAAPLLPPPRNSGRVGPAVSSPQLRLDTRAISPEQSDKGGGGGASDGDGDEEPLYLLQPRTYTPQTPDPPPSPMLMPAPTFKAPSEPQRQSQRPEPLRESELPEAVEARRQSQQPEAVETRRQSQQPEPLQKRTSLRQRVSLKTTPPDAIQIPPRFSFTPIPRPSPGYTTPRTSNSQVPDSAYGSDIEPHHLRQRSRGGSQSDLSPPARPPLMPSPHSDHHQHYRPVRASPHSPLQQRPHTAVPSDAGSTKRPSAYYPQHQRNQPSRLGGMSTLSTVTTATQQDRPKTPGAATQGGDKTLKKKKSAFGWLKKAFSLDEEEKAAYEARRLDQQQNGYYNQSDPLFLDGRRIR